ncbi:hypothetical protein Tco_1263315 [Tanacetum coccineum]
MAEGLSSNMLMEHRDAQGQSVFTSRAWRRLFDIRGPLVHELILEFFSTFRFGEAVLDLDTTRALQFLLGGVRRRLSWREFILTLRLHIEEEMQIAGFGLYWAENFLGTTPSYTSIRDQILRLCHRLIACSIAIWNQAHEKGPIVIVRELPVIDMSELARLQICIKIDDTWAWVAPGPERQPDAAAGAPEAAEDAPIADEGALAVPAPVQAPQPPPPAARPTQTMAQRLARVEEDVYEIRGALDNQREILDNMARDFSQFSTWTVVGLSQMMSWAGVSKTGSKFSTIVREYVTEPSTPSKSRAELRRESVYKSVEAEKSLT